MSKDKEQGEKPVEAVNEATMTENSEQKEDQSIEEAAEQENPQDEIIETEVEKLSAEVAEAKDKYLRLFSEFENYRRRTSKEKLDLIKTATEDLVVALIPVADDFERAMKNVTDKTDLASFQEGVVLIQQKFNKALVNKGLQKIDSNKGDEFNDEIHEAITQIPAPEESLKGKIVDIIEPGYRLGDKVVRFAKVVTGA